MPKAPNLTAMHLRDLARTGAEVTLKRLRSEVIAIERTLPRAAVATAPTCRPSFVAESSNTHTHDVGRGAQGGVGTDETVLGGATEGAGEGEVRTRIELISSARGASAPRTDLSGASQSTGVDYRRNLAVKPKAIGPGNPHRRRCREDTPQPHGPWYRLFHARDGSPASVRHLSLNPVGGYESDARFETGGHLDCSRCR